MQAERLRTERSHPEQDSSLLSKLWHALFKPEIRLGQTIPWGAKEFSKTYAVALVYYLVGSFTPILLFMIALAVMVKQAPLAVVAIAYNHDGSPNLTFVVAATVTSFVCGFGMQLWYIRKALKKQGTSLSQALAMNLDTLNGSWKEAFKRSSIALIIALFAQALLTRLPLAKPQQATAELAANLQGPELLLFGVLAVVAAPLFEEIIFRGFLFNSLRSILKQGKMFELMHRSPRFADYIAICVSALIFAAAHLEPSAFLHLFALGIILAELYRRTGTLVCPILLHAFNNLLALLIVATR